MPRRKQNISANWSLERQASKERQCTLVQKYIFKKPTASCICSCSLFGHKIHILASISNNEFAKCHKNADFSVLYLLQKSKNQCSMYVCMFSIRINSILDSYILLYIKIILSRICILHIANSFKVLMHQCSVIFLKFMH